MGLFFALIISILQINANYNLHLFVKYSYLCFAIQQLKITKMNTETKKTIVCFHVGGITTSQLSYKTYVRPKDVLKYNDTNLFTREHEGEEWYFDSNDHALCSLSDFEKGEFQMEFDGNYNTWYCQDIASCTEAELKAIIDADCDHVEIAKEYMVANGYVPQGWYNEEEEIEE